MNVIAADIVLLPDPETARKAIEANQYLVQWYDSDLLLHRTQCLPHISLSMGCIDTTQLDTIEKHLWDIVSQSSLQTLACAGIGISRHAHGQMVSSLEITRDPTLQRLHETVMQHMAPFYHSDVTEDMIFGDELVSDSTLEWIRQYTTHSAFHLFEPHITLGYGPLPDRSLPKTIGIQGLALCHLGNHCSCRKALIEIPWNQPNLGTDPIKSRP